MNCRLIVPNECRGTGKSVGTIDPLIAYGPSIARLAGGFTSTQGIGGWIDDHEHLIIEPITVFDVDLPTPNMGEARNHKVRCLENLARSIAQELNQQCVYLRVGDEVRYVKP